MHCSRAPPAPAREPPLFTNIGGQAFPDPLGQNPAPPRLHTTPRAFAPGSRSTAPQTPPGFFGLPRASPGFPELPRASPGSPGLPRASPRLLTPPQASVGVYAPLQAPPTPPQHASPTEPRPRGPGLPPPRPARRFHYASRWGLGVRCFQRESRERESEDRRPRTNRHFWRGGQPWTNPPRATRHLCIASRTKTVTLDAPLFMSCSVHFSTTIYVKSTFHFVVYGTWFIMHLEVKKPGKWLRKAMDFWAFASSPILWESA